MADHPTVTTPGGSDIFAGLASLDYATFNDESMALLVDDNLATGQNAHDVQQQHDSHASGATNGSASGSATTATSTEMKSGLTPGGGDAFLMTPRTAGFMAELAVNTPANQRQTSTAMLFDHDLVTNGSSGTGGGGVETVVEEDEEDSDTLRQDDLPTPLTFSFTPTGGAGGGGPSSTGSLGLMGARYHVAAAHKHKRVRSNPDMLQNLSFQQLLGNPSNSTNSTNQGSSSASPLRPSVESHSLPTTPMDSSGAMPEPLPISIGTVNVVTPVGFHGSVSPIRHGKRNGNRNGDDAGEEHDAFPSDMDSFLKEMQWSELAENNNSMNVDTLSSLGGAPSASSAGYLSQRIQAGMNELKMKRKRPTQHMRHHSNPVDLLHNIDQFRLLSQQQQSQQPHISPPHSPPMQQYPSPTKLDDMGTGMAMGVGMNMGMNMDTGMAMGMEMGATNHMGMAMAMQQQQPMMQPHMQAGMMLQQQPNVYGMPQQDMQFQVPNQIANGTARSLHSRRSSMPNSAFSRGSSARGHRAPRGGSTGLSMDMSHMNLEFLTLPEDQFQQKLHEQQVFQQAMGLSGSAAGATGMYASPPTSPPLQQYPHQNSPPQRGGASTSKQLSAAAAAAAAIEESNRKSYKCGRCGQPKVGHVCTMPDLRNNWTQADLEITKGTKLVRTNCHIVATKTKWVPLHEDNL